MTTKLARYARRTGITATVDPDTAACRIHLLRRRGLRDPHIATAARVGVATVYRIARRHGPITRAVETRILAIPVPTAPTTSDSTATLPAAGTTRRLQALVRNGFPPAVLAIRLGRSRQQLHELLHGHHPRVAAHVAADVAELFANLWDQQAEHQHVTGAAAHRARALAAEHGFLPALAWDNIDNPDAVPDLGDDVSRLKAVVEDTAELVREGLSREGIAARLGIQWDAVRQAHRRAGAALPTFLD